MASPLFLRGLLDDLGLEPFFGVHLLEPTVLVFESLHSGHQQGVHAAKPGPSFVEGRGTDAVLAAELRYRAAALRLLQDANDLAVGESGPLHVKLPLRIGENSTSGSNGF